MDPLRVIAQLAWQEASSAGTEVGTEHVLVAVIKAGGLGARILERAGLTLRTVRAEMADPLRSLDLVKPVLFNVPVTGGDWVVWSEEPVATTIVVEEKTSAPRPE